MEALKPLIKEIPIQSVLDRNGNLYVPAAVRRFLNLQIGNRVTLHAAEGNLLILRKSKDQE